MHLPVACTFAVITSLALKADKPDKDQLDELMDVVVPMETPPLYTVTVEPLASELVPLTKVAPEQIDETVGVAELD